jgi:hypothetical protein
MISAIASVTTAWHAASARVDPDDPVGLGSQAPQPPSPGSDPDDPTGAGMGSVPAPPDSPTWPDWSSSDPSPSTGDGGWGDDPVGFGSSGGTY